ncbi:MAG: DUF2231 domain-containing protein [Methylocystaceae bacterium]|nr:DUF2231 domain-containing protein [Methylocystaceae bacterium]
MLPIQHIHPIIVHFPIVFVLTLAALDLIAITRGSLSTGRTAYGNVSAGLAVSAAVFALIAFQFGDIALEFAEDRGFHSDIAETHEMLGMVLATVLTLWGALRALLWWRNIKLSGPVLALVPVVELACAGIVLATAFYGGQLIYTLGVNVAH